MSELSVGQLRGLTVNSNVITVPTGHTLYAPGHVIQVVRFTDATNRATTSGSFVDVTGNSVTITPKSATSRILVIASYDVQLGSSSFGFAYGGLQISNLSNVALSGAERMFLGTPQEGVNHFYSATAIGYVEPGTTSAVTFKLRFRTGGGTGTITLDNSQNTGQLIAMEIAS